MITDEELATLPADPMLAFLKYEQFCRSSMESMSSPQNWDAEKKYITYVRAFIAEMDIDLTLPAPPAKVEDFPAYLTWVKDKVDSFTARERIKAFKEKRISHDVLVPEGFKGKIHSYIESIRKIVNASDLTLERRDAIISRLNSLSAEVDRSRSRIQALSEVWLEITRAVGEGFENLSPALDRIDKIAGLFGRGRDAERGGILPAPEDTKLLAPPDDDGRVGSDEGAEG